jgi:inositol hexakisphosphate/diphosphoinositol-pentakisphosphate kinase
LRDFGAVREEATVAWREATLQRTSSAVSSMGRMSQAHLADDGGASGGEEEDDGGFRLHAQYAEDVNSTSRHVRTRVYFTSESHLHALVNVIRYAHLAAGDAAGAPSAGCAPLVSAAGEAALARVSELDYMSTVVFRMFELKNADPKDPNKFRMELLFSPGAAGDPFAAPEGSHALPVTPRVPLWADPAGGPPLTLNRVEATLGAHAAGWRSKGCPELGHQRSASGSSALGARDSG